MRAEGLSRSKRWSLERVPLGVSPVYELGRSRSNKAQGSPEHNPRWGVFFFELSPVQERVLIYAKGGTGYT